LALYAIARDRELGIDLERIRPLPDAEKIAQRFFSAREHTMICSLPTSKQHEAFFHCWTCKEAYLKATGDGLSGSLNQVDILLAPGEPAKLLSVAGNEQEASRWCLQQLMPVPGYMAALVVEGHGWRLACWQWSE
jgi:4'-phosphopantetheinyl transferase